MHINASYRFVHKETNAEILSFNYIVMKFFTNLAKEDKKPLNAFLARVVLGYNLTATALSAKSCVHNRNLTAMRALFPESFSDIHLKATKQAANGWSWQALHCKTQ
jgi:hypothetical protein